MFHAVFSLFLLLFLALSQSDVTGYLLALLAGRPLPSHPWLTALLFVAVPVIWTWWGGRWMKTVSGSAYPAFLMAVWGVAATLSAPFVSITWQIGLLIVAVGLFSLDRWSRFHWERSFRHPHTFWQQFMPSLVRMLALFLYMGVGVGVSDTDHYELRTAEALRSGREREAFQVGGQSLSVTPRLFAMRCYSIAVAGSGGLGSKLFEQPVPAGGASSLLLPDDHRQRLLWQPAELSDLLGAVQKKQENALDYFRRCAYNCHSNHSDKRFRTAVDYYLSALLLDRRLDDFAREVSHFYPQQTRQGRLPLYFAQALLLYNRLRTQPTVLYADATVAENLRDYVAMGDTLADRKVRCNLLRREYGETYWWWYEYAK